MTDKEYAPLSSLCVRSLNDKLYEKRKQGALEVERLMKDLVQQNNDVQIKRVLKVLGDDFALSGNPNTRKGGLIGLAAAAIALGKESCIYVNELVKPVLACFRDQDSRVRYYSCEALYNIVKVTRGSVLPFFNEIFDALSKLAADPDQNVKNGTELLDRLIKDIVTESSSFDLVAFIPLLRERIYNQNPFARQFIVSWVATLDAVPDINMLVLLPEIIDGLFQILGDQNQEIRKMCQNVLSEFLNGIKKAQGNVNFAGMANILIIHSQNEEDHIISYTAIMWLREFVVLSGRAMLPFVSGILNAILPKLVSNDIEHKSRKSVREAAEGLNYAVMDLIDKLDDNPTPAIGSPSDQSEHSKQTREKIQSDQVQVTPQGNVTSNGEVSGSQKQSEEDGEGPYDVDTHWNRLIKSIQMSTHNIEFGIEITKLECLHTHLSVALHEIWSIQLDVLSVIEVLCKMVGHRAFQTRIASLKWFYHLLNEVPTKTFRHMSRVFPVLVNTLADKEQSDEAVWLALQALAKISSHPAGLTIDNRAIQQLSANLENSSINGVTNTPRNNSLVSRGANSASSLTESSETKTETNQYFMEFMVQILELFRRDRYILDKRGAFIIRQLCVLLSAEDIFQSISEILIHEADLKFSCTMVQTLNSILLTSTELFELRNQLRDLQTRESCQLFCCLYKSWSHSPVSTIALCYLSQNYTHACRLLPIFGTLEITVDFLNEIDKLIQLIESPIFAYLRLQLLDSEHSEDLVKSLYGLLMLLPQAEPFTLLRNRLNCIPHFQIMSFTNRKPTEKVTDSREFVREIDFEGLLQHFISVQKQHRESRKRHMGYKSGH